MSAKCDFCSAADPEWFYSAESFDMADVAGEPWGSSGGWAACETCSGLIERGAWEVLAKRTVDNNPTLTWVVTVTRGMRRLAIREAARLHRVFAARRRGPRRPFG